MASYAYSCLDNKSRVITCHLQVLNETLITYVIMKYEHVK